MDVECSCNGGAETILELHPNSTISVTYHPEFGPRDELLLLELDDKLLPDVLCGNVSIRGEPDEDAVLCTNSKTYAMKFVGTSNSAFLIPPSSSDKKSLDENGAVSVIKLASGNMELVEIAPKIDKLKSLLSQNLFSFEEASEIDISTDNKRSKTGLYTWDDLIERIRASDMELRSGLKTLSAVEINGYWRILDQKYMDSVLNMLLHNAVINEWSFDALPEKEVIETLESDGFSRQIVTHCLYVFGQKTEEQCVWKLDETRVCVHFAKEVLRGGKMKMESFVEAWKRKIPRGIQASIEMLEGEVLRERVGIETWVYGFSVSSLPSSPAERFSMLFKERAKWEWKDLQPYIRDLKVPGLSSESLLLKYTRRTQPTLDVEPIFSAR